MGLGLALQLTMPMPMPVPLPMPAPAPAELPRPAGSGPDAPEPTDPAAVAFASLLAALVAPQPPPVLPPAGPSPAVLPPDAPAPVVFTSDDGPIGTEHNPEVRDARPVAPPPAVLPAVVPAAPVVFSSDDRPIGTEHNPEAVGEEVGEGDAVPGAPAPRRVVPREVEVLAPSTSRPVPPEAVAALEAAPSRGADVGIPPKAFAPHAVEVTAPVTAVPDVRRPEVVAAPVPVPATPAPEPRAVAQQVVRAVVPLRKLPDGTHRVVLELRPAELGTVRVELSVDAGTVHVGMRADTPGTDALLHAALPEVRAQLDAAGLAAGRVAVGFGAEGGQGGPAWRAAADRRARRASTHDRDRHDHDAVDDIPTGYSTAAPGHVDLRL
jgi:hypothetical protein